MLIALPNQPAAGGSAYNSLYGEALTERGTFFRLSLYKREGLHLLEYREFCCFCL